jgi:hypothetical protein
VNPDLRAALRDLAADAAQTRRVVALLRERVTWWVPHDSRGDASLHDRSGRRFLPAGTEARDVAAQGTPRVVPAELVWAWVAADHADGVLVDPEGPHPLWLDRGGVLRVAGPPGLDLEGHPAARSVAEIHLVLDLLGWPPGDRGHRLVAEGAELFAEYTWPEAPDGVPGRVRVIPPAEEPPAGAFAPDHAPPSRLLDPAGWVFAADLLSHGIPARPPREDAGAWRRRVERAAGCLTEALRFATDQVLPDAAFHTRTGRLLRDLSPGRYDPPRLAARRAALRALLARA